MNKGDLLESLKVSKFERDAVDKPETNRFSFRRHESPVAIGWAKVVELRRAPISGLQVRRGSLMAYDRARCENEWKSTSTKGWIETVKRLSRPTADGGFRAKEARSRLLKTESFTAKAIIRYAPYPFDVRWAYYSDATPLWNRPRPNLVAQLWRGNEFLVTRMFAERPTEQAPFIVTKALPDYHLLRPNAVAIPFRLRTTMKPQPKKDDGNGEFDTILREASPDYDGGSGKTAANLAPAARAYLAKLGVNDPDKDADTAA